MYVLCNSIFQKDQDIRSNCSLLAMSIETFSKYTAIGNDFVLIDNRDGNVQLTTNQRRRLCSRRFGIGSDGLIELKSSQECDFEFHYYNSDGELGSLCGNGARCVLAFARSVGMAKGHQVRFRSCDGILDGGFTELGMAPYVMFNQVNKIIKHDDENFYVHTGSPHHVRFVSDVDNIDVKSEGRAIAHGPLYGLSGANANFVEPTSDTCARIRTYERGVEDETLACGSGSVAAAIALWTKHKGTFSSKSEIRYLLKFRFGNLDVSFAIDHGVFTNIKLQGPVRHVFDGTYSESLKEDSD